MVQKKIFSKKFNLRYSNKLSQPIASHVLGVPHARFIQDSLSAIIKTN